MYPSTFIATIFIFFIFGCSNIERDRNEIISVEIIGVNNQSSNSIYQTTNYSTDKMVLRYVIGINTKHDKKLRLLADSINYILLLPDIEMPVVGRLYSDDVLLERDTFEVFVPFKEYLSKDEYDDFVSSSVSIKLTYKDMLTKEVFSIFQSNLKPKREYHYSTLPRAVNDSIKNAN
jgi:hypothetical protein